MLLPHGPLVTIASFLQPCTPSEPQASLCSKSPGAWHDPWGRSNPGHPHLGGQATALSPGQGTETQLENRDN